MNIFVAVVFLLAALLLPFKVLFSRLANWLLSLQDWRAMAIVDFIIAVPLIIWSISAPNWYYYTTWIAIFTVAVLAMCEGIYLLLTDSTVYKGQLQSVMKYYYRIAIPMALVCLSLSIFILGRAYIGPIADISNCESGQQLSVSCVVNNPEDLSVTPDNQFIIVSEFGGSKPLTQMGVGSLALVNVKTKRRVPLPIIYADNIWGDGRCEKNAQSPLGPHGIDLVTRDDGRYQLAVVNHMAHESIEMFELVALEQEPQEQAEDIERINQWGLVWRGCAVAPKGNFINDLSLLKDGSLFVSHMYDYDFSTTDFLTHAITKQDTGYVMHWDQQNGFSQVTGTEGAQPNGIAYDEERGLLYVAFNLSDRVVVIDLDRAETLHSFSLNAPDNLVLKDGSLWVTNLDHEIVDALSCENSSPCTLPFTVTQLDAATLKQLSSWSFILEPFGLPTVALPLGNEVLIGSFHADRLAFFNLGAEASD
ncbi:MAG: hypothetical protein P8M77_06385 [Porticoccaceae bacterium]|nr:hypothetical protein [Porticoccaceae bacterium]